MFRFIFPLILAAAPTQAQDLSFQIGPTEECLWNSGHGGDKRACIGQAATRCMDQPGGSSTVGMGFCLDRELGWWDAMLNDAYTQLRQAMQAADDGLPANLAIQASSLRDMQRAWIDYRDARCGHEAALWQGGTGSGPAYLNCLMQETAEQALYLGALYSGEG
jgi:uncharacterized protein YecT (DUF1311 family)